jgi:diguanylate cyclase (GGDEF)-like protein
VNSSFGLVVGDSLLLTVARRLGRNIGPQDTLGRVGGDQFALLLLSQSDPRELALLAEQVRRSLRAPIQLAGQEIVLTASIGISLYDGPDDDPAELLREAEIAMYRAKRSGADRIEIFNAEMRSDKDGRLALESDLRKAIEKKQIKLVYQPIFYLPTESLAGFEALMRWEPSAPRHAQPHAFHSCGGRIRPDRQARLLCPGPCRARGAALAAGAAAPRRAAVRQRQRVEPPAV